ncbi:10301_t:CDS:2, partial [Acaulospora colombiana]
MTREQHILVREEKKRRRMERKVMKEQMARATLMYHPRALSRILRKLVRLSMERSSTRTTPGSMREYLRGHSTLEQPTSIRRSLGKCSWAGLGGKTEMGNGTPNQKGSRSLGKRLVSSVYKRATVAIYDVGKDTDAISRRLLDQCRGLSWMDTYGEEDIRSDLWTIYLMLLENDGRNGIFLTCGARLSQFIEMLSAVFLGKRVIRRTGWPIETQERSLLAWILYIMDPMPADFEDQDLYNETKLSMRSFLFASFKLFERWIPPPTPPLFKYSNDPLIPVQYYSRVIFLYAPSIAVAAMLWYFRGHDDRMYRGLPAGLLGVDNSRFGDLRTPQRRNPNGAGGETLDSPTSSDSLGSRRVLSPNRLALSPTPSRPRSISPASSTTSLRHEVPGWTSPVLCTIPSASTTDQQNHFIRTFYEEVDKRQFNCASKQFELEWTGRLDDTMRFGGSNPNLGYKLGSLEGVWEGGFLYLDFTDYAKFLTGESEANPDFYQKSPDDLYGSNRQVWRLKEYVYEERQGSTWDRDHPPRYPMLQTAGPLSVGKWIDGWLPPADMLEWRLSDEGDELDIIETIHPSSLQSSGFGVGFEQMKKEKRISEEDADDFVTHAPAEQRRNSKKGVGKIRGRTVDLSSATETKLRPGSTAKSTPVSPMVTNANVHSVRSPPLSSPPNARTSVVINKDLTSPKSPETPEEKKRFRWSWKPKKKDKNQKEEPRRSSLPPTKSSMTVSPSTPEPTSGRERRTGSDEPVVRIDLEINPFELEDEEPEPPRQNEDIEYDGEEEAPVYGPPPPPSTYQQIARYVRYNPNVQWAKKAIWAGSPQYGASRRTTMSAAASSAGKMPSGSAEDEDVSRSIEQNGISDVLVFGE